MTADIELLPLPEVLPFSAAGARKALQDWCRANVAHHTAELQAEIEALRAEARDLRKRQAGWERHVASAGCEYVREGERDVLVNRRAERLAEALRWYANPEVYKPHPHGPAFDDRDLSFKARAALRDHDQEVGND